MALSEMQLRRARYVRTVLSWHDWTQAELGGLLGITAQAANRKLKGVRMFKDDELLSIADAFGIDPSLLLRPPELNEVLGAPPVAEPAGSSRERWKAQLGLVSGHAMVRPTRAFHAVCDAVGTARDRLWLPEPGLTRNIYGLVPCVTGP